MSDINEIKRLIADSEGLELSNWSTATHAQREAWASIETQGRAWIIDFITTIESQNSQIESLKAITELAVKSLRDQKFRMLEGQKFGFESETVFWERCLYELETTFSEIERLSK